MAADSHTIHQAMVARLAQLEGDPSPSAVIQAMVGPDRGPCATCAAQMLGCTELDLCVVLAVYPSASAFRQFVERLGPDNSLLGHGLAALAALLTWQHEVAVMTARRSFLLPSVVLLIEAYREAIKRIEALADDQDIYEDDEEEDEDEDDEAAGDEDEDEEGDGHFLPEHKLDRVLEVPRRIAKGARVLLSIDDHNALNGYLAMLCDITPQSVSAGIQQLFALSRTFFATAKDLGTHLPDFLRDATGASDVAVHAELIAQHMEQMTEKLDHFRSQLDPSTVMSSYLEFALEEGVVAASDTLDAFLEEHPGGLV